MSIFGASNMTMNFDPTHIASLIPQLVERCPAVEWITDDSRIDRLSHDFYWFSPVLKRALEPMRAHIGVRPRTEDEIRAVVSACATLGVPITARGSGTGNYGQCIPLHGGVLLDLSGYNQLLWHKPGVVRGQAGLRLGDIDARTRPAGWELRCVPSTYRSASLGGLYGGGFGGVGSINFGPLAAHGNVLGVKAISIEPEPRTVELRAPEALVLHHAYGTNGLVLELEVGLGTAHEWMESIVLFDDFDAALTFADTVANAPGIVKKSVTVFAAPIGEMLTMLAAHLPAAKHAVFVLTAEFSEQVLAQLITEFDGVVSYRKTAEEVKKSNRTLVEFTWNHTTLHAMKVDKTLTYIQSGFTPGEHVRQVREMRNMLGDEVITHVEFIRSRDGLMTCAGLQLVRYTTDARLNEIMQMHRDHGVSIANPHVYHVEDGKQGVISAEVVAAKLRFDPQGLLNPGKPRGWEQRERLALDARSATPTLATLPRF